MLINHIDICGQGRKLLGIRALTDSQCRSHRRAKMWQHLGVLQTSLAEAFKTVSNLLSW